MKVYVYTEFDWDNGDSVIAVASKFDSTGWIAYKEDERNVWKKPQSSIWVEEWELE